MRRSLHVSGQHGPAAPGASPGRLVRAHHAPRLRAAHHSLRLVIVAGAQGAEGDQLQERGDRTLVTEVGEEVGERGEDAEHSDRSGLPRCARLEQRRYPAAHELFVSGNSAAQACPAPPDASDSISSRRRTPVTVAVGEPQPGGGGGVSTTSLAVDLFAFPSRGNSDAGPKRPAERRTEERRRSRTSIELCQALLPTVPFVPLLPGADGASGDEARFGFPTTKTATTSLQWRSL